MGLFRCGHAGVVSDTQHEAAGELQLVDWGQERLEGEDQQVLFVEAGLRGGDRISDTHLLSIINIINALLLLNKVSVDKM